MMQIAPAVAVPLVLRFDPVIEYELLFVPGHPVAVPSAKLPEKLPGGDVVTVMAATVVPDEALAATLVAERLMETSVMVPPPTGPEGRKNGRASAAAASSSRMARMRQTGIVNAC